MERAVRSALRTWPNASATLRTVGFAIDDRLPAIKHEHEVIACQRSTDYSHHEPVSTRIRYEVGMALDVHEMSPLERARRAGAQRSVPLSEVIGPIAGVVIVCGFIAFAVLMFSVLGHGASPYIWENSGTPRILWLGVYVLAYLFVIGATSIALNDKFGERAMPPALNLCCSVWALLTFLLFVGPFTEFVKMLFHRAVGALVVAVWIMSAVAFRKILSIAQAHKDSAALDEMGD